MATRAPATTMSGVVNCQTCSSPATLIAALLPTGIDTPDVTTELAEQPAAVSRQIVVGWSAFSIDIESNPADGDRIFKIGAVRSDAEVVVSLSTGRMDARDVVRRVDDAAQGARVLVGHNLRRHDVPLLRRQYPGLGCLNLPVIDTLELSAIAFPANPYHRLVKGYKLLSDSRNDPVKDARLTLDLLVEEVDALFEMHRVQIRTGCRCCTSCCATKHPWPPPWRLFETPPRRAWQARCNRRSAASTMSAAALAWRDLPRPTPWRRPSTGSRLPMRSAGSACLAVTPCCRSGSTARSLRSGR
jgi:hypothetical protein